MQNQTEQFNQFMKNFKKEYESLSKFIAESKNSQLNPEQINQLTTFLEKLIIGLSQYSLFELTLFCTQLLKCCKTLLSNQNDDKHALDFLHNNFNQLPSFFEGNISVTNSHSNLSLEKKACNPLIYVVDDEPMLLELFEMMLQVLPIRIKTFNNPEKVIEDFLFDRPALILSDMKMPEMTGSELLKKVRLLDQAVSFIFISGYINKDNVLDFMNLGVYGVIEKPFKAPQVLSLVEKSLKNYEIKSIYNQNFEKVLLKTYSSSSEEMKKLIEELLENRKNLFQYT
jgi:FixJ family two-component response regulator